MTWGDLLEEPPEASYELLKVFMFGSIERKIVMGKIPRTRMMTANDPPMTVSFVSRSL